MRLIVLTLALMFIAPAGFCADKEKGNIVRVTIKNHRFTPDTIKIKIGDTVVWINADNADHTVNESNGAFASDTLKSGQKFSFTFDKAGKYAYECKLHPRMKGTIVVAE